MMGKILGKAIVLFFVAISFSIKAKGVLQAVDEMGSSFKSVQVGRPFVIEFNLSGSGSLDEAPIIEGLDQFEVQNSSWSHSIINGKVSIAYQYSVIAKKPRTYTVGPALFYRDGKREVSNTVQITASTEQTVDENQKAPVFVRLSVDKQRMVVGERVVATLRYYYTNPSHRLRNFVEQQAENVVRKKARGPRQASEMIDDIEYDYIELDWDMFPKKAGQITIPAFAAEYEDKMSRKHNSMFGEISRLFGMAAAKKRAYSNAVTLQVDPIPSDQKVQAVGTINSFELTASPSIVLQGEGAVITLSLKGNFDPDQITIEGLQGVPDELRYYESKESAEEPSSATDLATKQFEYIVQGLQTGSFEIPAQQFHYFDVNSRKNRTIATAPLSMMVKPGAPKKSSVKPPTPTAEQKQNTFPVAKGELCPKHTQFFVPWWLFFLLLVIPFFVWAFLKGQHSFYVHQKKNYRTRRAYQAFSNAQASLSQLKQENKNERLYTLFIELFADKWQIPIGSITEEYITERLKDIGMPEGQREQWNDFFTLIAQQAFGAQQSKQQATDLFKKAEQWLEQLQQLL